MVKSIICLMHVVRKRINRNILVYPSLNGEMDIKYTQTHTHHQHHRHTVASNTPINIKYILQSLYINAQKILECTCVLYQTFYINREMMVICCLYQFHKRKYLSNVMPSNVHYRHSSVFISFSQ